MQARSASLGLLLLVGCATARTAVPTPAGPAISSAVGPQEVDAEAKPTGDARPVDPTARLLLDAHNARRRDAELPPLTLDANLSTAAREHSEAMARTGELEHEGPEDGSTFAERIDRTGYRHRASAENIAEGARNVAEVMDDWMNSPGHKKNILGDFEQMGAARVKDAKGRWFWAVEFATPWPTVDAKAAPAEVVRLLNGRRAEEGLGTLRIDDALKKIADELAVKLAAHGKADGFDSSVAFRELKRRNVRFTKATVSISLGHGTAVELVEGLAKDADSDLLGAFTRIGVGAANTGEGIPCWFLLLAK